MLSMRDSSEAVVKLCQRLSLVEDLSLPSSLTRDRDTQPSQEEVATSLNDLLRRDPSVFLERYGNRLGQVDLELFDHLSSDYEVDFYLKRLRASMPTTGTSIRVKNRRLAHMMKLLDEGKYFGDEHMRDRDPLLFQHYIGNTAFNSTRPKTLSESILQSADEQEIQRRLAYAEENEPQGDDEDLNSNTETDALNPAHDVRFMRNEFEMIMQERFLSGQDGDYVDYNIIDNDATLDDDLLEIEDRDKEADYFDSD